MTGLVALHAAGSNAIVYQDIFVHFAHVIHKKANPRKNIFMINH